ncbi:MAG: hypothetical protein ACLQFF_09370 [Steroidobacteraceae bacterium]|jgi:hypothetical protein
MRIAKPLLLITTTVGVITSVISTIRCERRQDQLRAQSHEPSNSP